MGTQEHFLNSDEDAFQAEDRVDVRLYTSDDGGESWDRLREGDFRGTVTGGCSDFPNETQVLPDKPYPHGVEHASPHPFIITGEPFKVERRDGKSSLLRYVMRMSWSDQDVDMAN